MVSDIKGRVWKFGDDIDTDVITPGKYINQPMEETVKHVFEAISPRFAQDVKRGQIIVAGHHFGYGSSRETAPAALKAVGIAAVLAESFARTFYRNAIAIGLPAIACPKVSGIFEDGDTANISFRDSKIVNVTSANSLNFQPFPDEMLRVLEAGGIEYLLKKITSQVKNPD
jgi:3-isopropylmalate dehydratase small subunit